MNRDKNFRSHLTSEVCFPTPTSRQDFQNTQPHRPDVLSGALARFALRRFGSVADLVVNGDGGFHTPANSAMAVFQDRQGLSAFRLLSCSS
jgi:hypothetical protein